MPSYNDYLHESLKLLYEYLPNFQISIDLIQKLAQHLKLDTFVDSEVQDPDTNQLVKRLSIAGSLLLVDIDFKDPHTVTKVSLALGNHSTSAVNTASSQLELNSVISTTKIDNTTIVRVNFLEENVLSFLNIRNADEKSVAEIILKENLKGSKLGNFPLNLRYLANLDRLSPQEGDLVLYLDNIAKYLEVIHIQECKLTPEDENIKSGQSSLIGKLMYNDEEANELGVFLHFWKSYNKTNKLPQVDYFKPQSFVGRLSVIESNAPAKDYLRESTKALWEPKDANGNFLEYKITFDDEKHLPKGVPVSGPNTRNWQLQFSFNRPVYLPKEVLEFLGFDDFEVAEDHELKDIFEAIEQFKVVDLTLDSHPNVAFQLNHSSFSSFIPVSAVTLPSLNSISKLLPPLRNSIVYSTWLTSLVLQTQCQISDAYSTEAKKQRDTRPELTEDELLGINSMAENNTYVGVQILDSNTNTDLEDFLKQEDEDENMDKDNGESKAVTPVEQGPFMELCFDDVDFTTKELEFQFVVDGKTQSGKPIQKNFLLQIGQTVGTGLADDLPSVNFVKALSLGEDLLLALDVVN